MPAKREPSKFRTLSYTHRYETGGHTMTALDSEGRPLCESEAFSEPQALKELLRKLEGYMLLRGADPEVFCRRKFAPCNFKVRAKRLIIPQHVWDYITLMDYAKGFIGLTTEAELGRAMGITRQAIHEKIKHGRLDAVKVGNDVWIPTDQLEMIPGIKPYTYRKHEGTVEQFNVEQLIRIRKPVEEVNEQTD